MVLAELAARPGITIGSHTFDNTIGKLISTLGNLGDISWTTTAVSAGVLIVIGPGNTDNALAVKRQADADPGRGRRGEVLGGEAADEAAGTEDDDVMGWGGHGTAS